jgi:urease accessory protein
MQHDHQHRLRVTAILGHATDAHLAEALAALEQQDAVDTIFLDPEDLPRRRLQVESAQGRLVQISLPREQQLADGAVLFLHPNLALKARVGARRILRLIPQSKADALALGYHAGNLHWKVDFREDALLVTLTGAPDTYLQRLYTLGLTGRFLAELL